MSQLTDFFVRHYTLVLDNEQDSYNAAVECARQEIVDSGLTMAEYAALSRDEREADFGSPIGKRIAELIDEMAGDLPMIAAEVMMHHDSEVTWGLGAHYVPEPSDMDGLLPEDDEDDDEDD